MSKRAAIIVLDGLGIGPAPDTAAYGDGGSDTLGNVARAVGGGLKLPNLKSWDSEWIVPFPDCRQALSRRLPMGWRSRHQRGRTARRGTGRFAACC